MALAVIWGCIKECWVRACAEAGDGDHMSPGGSSLGTWAGSYPQGKALRGPRASWERGDGGLAGRGGMGVKCPEPCLAPGPDHNRFELSCWLWLLLFQAFPCPVHLPLLSFMVP